MKVLGIDPGTHNVGYGVLEKNNGAIRSLEYGVVRSIARRDLSFRLGEIYRKLDTIIGQIKPDIISIEKVFFGVNVKSAISLGEGRGIILLLADLHDIEIHEFSPTQIKKAVTGNGRAQKYQIQKMMQGLLKLKDMPGSEDAADALAAAYCFLNSSKFQQLIKQT